MATYNINTALSNCTADADNPKTIDSDSTAELVFGAATGFPFNAYVVTVDGAKASSVVAADKKSVTVTLSEATKNVILDVEAQIDQSVNTKYVVINGELYVVFNNRKKVKWNKRWLKQSL